MVFFILPPPPPPPRPKGDNVDVKAITDRTVGAQQCYVVFDVLMVNDTNFANCPLCERIEELKK